MNKREYQVRMLATKNVIDHARQRKQDAIEYKTGHRRGVGLHDMRHGANLDNIPVAGAERGRMNTNYETKVQKFADGEIMRAAKKFYSETSPLEMHMKQAFRAGFMEGLQVRARELEDVRIAAYHIGMELDAMLFQLPERKEANVGRRFADAANWVCDCGERCDPSSAAWRWNGQAWEHKCAGAHPQCGHFVAQYRPESAFGSTTEEAKE